MIYRFQCDGEIIEKVFPIGEAPREIAENGKVYTKMFEVPAIRFPFNQTDFAKEEAYLARIMDENPTNGLRPAKHK